MQYCDLFREVRQRVAAFKYYQEFFSIKGYGKYTEDEYLDNAFRFLYSSVIDINNDNFLKFCAQKEKMPYTDYIKMLLKSYRNC